MKKIKAIFLDHMGTMVKKGSKYAQEVMERTYKNSHASSLDEVTDFWFENLDRLTGISNGDEFKTVYELSMESFRLTDEKFNIEDDLNELGKILEKNWIYAPMYTDTKEFFEKSPLPIYVLSNNDDRYLEEAIKNMGIKPDGLISSEMAQAYKPRKEIFQLALEVSNCSPDEVVHIGDSIENDVMGARAVGIEGWLIDRKDKYKGKDIKGFSSLLQALDEITKRSS